MSTYRNDIRRELDTLRRLNGKEKLTHLWTYYRYFFLAVICAAIALVVTVQILWEGQRPRRLQVCVVLNTEESCSQWFDSFEQRLTADGKPGAVIVNEDQIFDYDNSNIRLHELTVMSAISAGQMDTAICGEDLYSYLLALNACLPLDENLPGDILELASSRLVHSTANLRLNEAGELDTESGIAGYYALDLTGTAFDQAYNQGSGKPLYAVILSNTEHLKDSLFLLRTLTEAIS